MKNELKPMIVKKNVRHVFTPEERAQLNVEFGQAYSDLKAVESDVAAEKSRLKARLETAEAAMALKHSTLQAGFEMRLQDCVVIFRPDKNKKDFYLQNSDGLRSEEPLLTEEMTQADFEQDLLLADSHFENRSELELWNAESDSGRMIVGFQKGKWFAAIRGNVANLKIEERLDSEQPATKKRFDAIIRAGKRANEWLKTHLGKDAAKGFEQAIFDAVEGEKEKVE